MPRIKVLLMKSYSRAISQLLALLDKLKTNDESTPLNSAHFTGKCLATNNLNSWIIDSGASNCICFDVKLFLKHQSLMGKNHYIIVLDGRKVRVAYKGTVRLNAGLILKDVFFVPDVKFNLISVSKLVMDMNCRLFFTNNECVIQKNLTKELLLL